MLYLQIEMTLYEPWRVEGSCDGLLECLDSFQILFESLMNQ